MRQTAIKGLSEVIGIISETVMRKIVRESRIVTPEMMLESEITLISNKLVRQTVSYIVLTQVKPDSNETSFK